MVHNALARLTRFFLEDWGVTAIDFGLLVALVVVGMLVGLSVLGTGVMNLWDHVANNASPVLTGAGTG